MLDYTQLKLIAEGNTAEIYQIDDRKILKLYRENMPSFLCERESESSGAARNIIKKVLFLKE